MNKWIVILLALALLLAACGPVDVPDTSLTTTVPTQPTQVPEVIATGTVKPVIMGMEWGPVISKVILELDCTVMTRSVARNDFSVQFPGADYHGISAGKAEDTPPEFDPPENIRDAYTCDQWGNRTGDSRYIALELNVDPDTPAPTIRSQTNGGMTFCDYYDMMVLLSPESGLKTTDGAVITSIMMSSRLNMEDAYYPQLENVFLDGSFTGSDGCSLTYGAYAPASDGQTHPLVIWLHGGGEGGTDIRSVIYGNEVTALFSEEFQSTMGGAYVLLPQSPTRWLELDEEGLGSAFRPALMELIEDYVNQNPAIDRDRIYVGGCSNGGFMTMDLILNSPDYFAAAYPICGAYDSKNITDTQVEAISHVPMWFVHAENDQVVAKDSFLDAAYRLRDAGAEVHISLFEDVHDTSGNYSDADGRPHQYIGHWSWIWFFNNECEADGLNMWQWLAQQSK